MEICFAVTKSFSHYTDSHRERKTGLFIRKFCTRSGEEGRAKREGIKFPRQFLKAVSYRYAVNEIILRATKLRLRKIFTLKSLANDTRSFPLSFYGKKLWTIDETL